MCEKNQINSITNMRINFFFKIFLLKKGIKCCEINAMKKKVFCTKKSWPNFTLLIWEKTKHIKHNISF
jgi:hypothetical protein